MPDPAHPASLDLDGLVQLLDQTRGEGLRWEFKENLLGNDDRLAKTVAGFANGEGGYIIFGVLDPERHQNTSSIDLVVGVLDTGFNNEFANKLRHKLEPEVTFYILPHRITIPGDPARAVRFVEVPKSTVGPHRYAGSGSASGTFPIRRAGGDTVSMTTTEVRAVVVSTLQIRGRLRILRAYIEQSVSMSVEIRDLGNAWWSYPDRFNVDPIDQVLVEVCIVLPDSDALFEKCFDFLRMAQRVNNGLDRPPNELARSNRVAGWTKSANDDVTRWGQEALVLIDAYLEKVS